jgi:hypothetical protein
MTEQEIKEEILRDRLELEHLCSTYILPIAFICLILLLII